MKPCKVIKVRRRKRQSPESAMGSGGASPFTVVHRVKFKPPKIWKRLMGFWL
jgi:hypothetical protein